MAFFLGIDGGGSKTSCVIGDEKAVLGAGKSSGSNPVRVGEEQARTALATAIGEACAAAKTTAQQISRTCVGMAGAARPQMSALVRSIVSKIVAGRIEVVGDSDIALNAAFGKGPGVIVIAGTGSIAYGRDVEGSTARAGGWGFAISDQGSGHWIGREALSAALRARDEQSQDSISPLLAAIMKAWQVESFEQLIPAANASPAPDFAALFPVVVSAAETGDAIAKEILSRAGGELARLAKLVVRRLGCGAAGLPVGMSGGVFRHSAVVREHFYNELRGEWAGLAISREFVEPVQGALALARGL